MTTEDGSAARPSVGAKRRYGTGHIFEKRNAWYGQWRVRNRMITRKLGPIRTFGSRDGLTRKMAGARLRKLMAAVTLAAVFERMTVSEAGERLINSVTSRLRAHSGRPRAKRSVRCGGKGPAPRASKVDWKRAEPQHRFGGAESALTAPLRPQLTAARAPLSCRSVRGRPELVVQ